MASMRDDVTISKENDLFSIRGTVGDVHYAGYPIGLAVADMKYLQYLLGEGYTSVANPCNCI